MNPVGFLHTGMELVVVGDLFYFFFSCLHSYSSFCFLRVSTLSVIVADGLSCRRQRAPNQGSAPFGLTLGKQFPLFFHSSHQPWKGKSSRVWLGGVLCQFFFLKCCEVCVNYCEERAMELGKNSEPSGKIK